MDSLLQKGALAQADRLLPVSKPKLLVVELWGLGDLVIATPFLQAACEKYAVTVLAKPFANDLQKRFWPAAQVAPFIAPWTAFRRKYRLLSWPWRKILRLRELVAQQFDIGLTARWDPRDHLLLKLLGARRRLGFPRVQSQLFLTDPLVRPEPTAHRYDHWRVLGRELGLNLPAREKLPLGPKPTGSEMLVHTGAAQPVRVWPLERYHRIIGRLRQHRFRVRVVCDPDQRSWWLEAGETEIVTPRTVAELMTLMDGAGAFLGNDSGPSHLAAFCGLPTFTLFGPQLIEWFAPLHPAGECFEGKACPYKPCKDSCRFPVPCCLVNLSEEEVWPRVLAFAMRTLKG